MDSENTIDIESCFTCPDLGMSYVLERLSKEYPWIELDKRDGYDNYNADIVKVIASACPNAAKIRNGNGELALHAAIRARKGVDVIRPIIGAYSEAISMVDSAGNTCLHLLAQQQPGDINMKQKIAKYVQEHGEDKASRKFNVSDMKVFIFNAIVDLDEYRGSKVQKIFDTARAASCCWFSADSFNERFEGLLTEGKLLQCVGGRFKLSPGCEVERNAEMEPLVRDLYQGKHLMSTDKRELIVKLATQYPESRVARNSEGKLPFHYFIHNTAQNNFDNVSLFMTEEAASMADNQTGLYGFMTAASIGDFDLSYQMLQAFPSVMGRFC